MTTAAKALLLPVQFESGEDLVLYLANIEKRIEDLQNIVTDLQKQVDNASTS